MARPAAETFDFTARIPVELQQRFIKRFPQYGSNTWFVRTMLEKFLDEVETQPSVEEQMNESLNKFLLERAQV